MTDLIRSITARLRKYVGNRRRVLRRGARFEVRRPFTVSLLGGEDGTVESLPNAPSLQGQTLDLSETGLTLLLASVRIRGVYLTNKENFLGIRLELPSGPLAMITASVRFEQLSPKKAGFGYLLGVRIIRMQDDDRDRYTAYLNTLVSKERRARERRQIQPTTALVGQTSASQISTWENLTPATVSQSFEKFLRK